MLRNIYIDCDGSIGNVFEDENEVNPREKHSKGSYLPLPRSRAPALIVKTMNEDDGQSIQSQLKVIVQIIEVLPAPSSKTAQLRPIIQ